MNANDITFGEFLQRKREEKEITLRRMAEKLSFSAPFLSDVEKGRRNPPDLAKLEQIAEILNLSDEDKVTMFDLAGKKRDVTFSGSGIPCPGKPGRISECVRPGCPDPAVLYRIFSLQSASGRLMLCLPMFFRRVWN